MSEVVFNIGFFFTAWLLFYLLGLKGWNVVRQTRGKKRFGNTRRIEYKLMLWLAPSWAIMVIGGQAMTATTWRPYLSLFIVAAWIPWYIRAEKEAKKEGEHAEIERMWDQA